MIRPRDLRRSVVAIVLLVAALGAGPALFAVEGGSPWGAPSGNSAGGLHAQTPESILVRFADGREGLLDVRSHRGYPAVVAGELEPLSWQVGRDGAVHRLLHRTGLELRFIPSTPYFRWDGELFQLVDSPYLFGDDLLLPLQLLTDFFPALLPEAYRWEPGEVGAAVGVLHASEAPPAGANGLRNPSDRRSDAERGDSQDPVTVGDRSATGGPPSSTADDPPASGDRPPSAADDPPVSGEPAVEPSADRPLRLVVIDPGHGGDDPGAIGPGGVREKEIALAIGLALRNELASVPDLEVRLTRQRDVAVPIWERGERATEWKGERPGLFISIHANALENRSGVRGFETYFLSEARTEHERRVAAAENAPLLAERGDDAEGVADPLLAGILRELRTFDHQQWSSLLAQLVQRELGTFHPGTDRGVKQGPLAVITNALMPAVLVEVGFVTNREEERLMMSPDFHREVARSLRRAVEEFFDRYPSAGG